MKIKKYTENNFLEDLFLCFCEEKKPGSSSDIGFKKKISERLKRADFSLVCEDNEKKIGFLLVSKAMISPLFSDDLEYFLLEYLYILPDYRGKGIAKKMLEEIFILAKNEKISQIRLHVDFQNVRAIRLYEKMNYTIKNNLYVLDIF